MAPSQLKRLKQSLRENGITGPQRSKKQIKRRKGNAEHQENRQAALQQIRDSFNPFELRAVSSRPKKFESFSRSGSGYKDVLFRPGVTKSAGEELRRQQLLPEMHRKNKVGGVVDRRIGEGDPRLTAEEKAMQRFVQEKRRRGANLFNLESDDDEPKVGLTHLGRSLDEDRGEESSKENFESEESGSDDGLLLRKRRRNEDQLEGLDREETEDEPERKKTKKEVMQEVIAKSKLHRYERQKAKEDDEDLREELDNGLADILDLLRGTRSATKTLERQSEMPSNGHGPKIDPERLKLIKGQDSAKADKEYEIRLKQLAQDARSKPSDPTKTEEEKAREEAERLSKLEEDRIKRMRGEALSDNGGDDASQEGDIPAGTVDAFGNDRGFDDAEEFGFHSTTAVPVRKEVETIVHQDEDEFYYDEDLIATDSEASDVDLSDTSEISEDEVNPEAKRNQEEDDEFVQGILGPATAAATSKSQDENSKITPLSGLSYTYPCPRSHTELLEVVKDVPGDSLPTIVQRIRALHHPSLSVSNKESMADFSAALVDHISYMGCHKEPLPIIEQLIRHLHSLSRTYPTDIACAFRKHLQVWHESDEGHPNSGDMVILTAIGSIYPTSDHFHQVVTPATTLMMKWLGLNNPDEPENRRKGAFLIALALNYQKLSKRFIPEAVRFTLKALAFRPVLPTHEQRPYLDNLLVMADLWKDKTAFIEIFTPFLPHLQSLDANRERQHLTILLNQSALNRRPLELHHHRPIPIRSAIPKFEESFNPDRHYDPNKERSDAKKLQKEYKRERKGALRELRKDASFIAREQLREKRERDAEYEKKQRRLVAEIQGEEGHERKEYEREKQRRKRARGRM